MHIAASLLAMMAHVASAAPVPEAEVRLPAGTTSIADIGIYQVAYQSYGGEVVRMPASWSGHFETTSGISYVAGGHLLGRRAILLHSPWRVAPGKVWVDYPLRLPNVKPITLSFGIAMKPEVATPDRSDGVTFSCYVVDGTTEREQMRKHQDQAEWLDFTFDLSEYAGKRITLRLQTEPGPDNDSGWDYSYFGDPEIVCGNAEQNEAHLLAELTRTKAYRAMAGKSLAPLSNDPTRGVTPSNLLPSRNAIARDGASFRFAYEGDDCSIVYTYTPTTGTLDDFVVQVDDSPAFRPAAGGGVRLAGEAARPVGSDGSVRSVRLDAEANQLHIRWQYEIDGQSVEVDWTFGIVGKALTVAAKCDQPVLSGFSLGREGMAPLRRSLGVPYLAGSLSYLPAQNAFACRYLDWTKSRASRCPQGEASYEAKTDGTRNTLFESGYVAVSPNVHEVLPNLPHPPSPYLDLLGPRIMLDVWKHHKGTYQGDADNLRALKDNGVDHVAIIQHVWQRYGYDVKLPDHLPANPQFGGDDGMIQFGKAANECGYVWSLHENYIDLYPDAPSYDETARVLRADGTPSPAWFNKGTGVQSFGLKCNRALGYAKQNSPEIHRRFGTNACYLDVHTCVPPWHQLDYDATQPMSAMALHKVQRDAELFQYERDTHGGPLFGEGNNHFYWAGLVDGVEAQVAGGEHHVPFLDFDLLKVHPQMVNHGMGYYERWFERGYSHQLGFDAGTPEQVDKYRAQELAYGHAGFIGSSQTDNVQWVAKEHHLMHPVQRLYGSAKPTEIAYQVDGQFVSASIALVVGVRDRQRVQYDSGLTVWTNWRDEPWEVEGRVLPQWGFLALAPDAASSPVAAPAEGVARPPAGAGSYARDEGTEAWTALLDGKYADYAECPEYLFVDARTSFHMPYLHSGKDIEPKLADFKYLGGNRIRLAYEWAINDALDDDYTCFVHFVNDASTGNDGIVFQQDHGLPRPTSQWRKGETLIDGPYEIEVPTDRFDTYDLVIGLYKGQRVPLKGLKAGGGRILIGRLKLERDGERLTNIALGDLDDLRAEREVGKADFSAHLNPDGTWIDFGKVATDGSVKINKGKRSLTVFPYPREKLFKVALDVGAISGEANVDPAKVRVKALAAGTQAELGVVPRRVEGGRVVFDVGMGKAGRYLVEW